VTLLYNFAFVALSVAVFGMTVVPGGDCPQLSDPALWTPLALETSIAAAVRVRSGTGVFSTENG
jgi:hypothetical protein